MIKDAAGRSALEEDLQSTLDISPLQVGMYYMVLFVNGRKSAAVPLVKL